MEFPQGVSVTDGAAVGLRHQALAYRGSAECLASVLSFVRDGLRRDEAVSVGVGRPVTRLLRQALPDEEPRIAFTDMTELGRNPGRIIAAMSDFASRNAGRAVRFVTEPFWPTRSPAEVIEATRHEALVNRAFAGAPVTALCLYDAGALDPAVLLTAHQTHPVIVSGGQAQVSLGYATPAAIPPECERALPPPPPWASFLPYAGDLRPVRALVARYATLAELPAGRAADLVLAASEIAANTLRHTGGHGTLHVWRTPDEFICQLRDQGHIADPLAGRRRAAGPRGTRALGGPSGLRPGGAAHRPVRDSPAAAHAPVIPPIARTFRGCLNQRDLVEGGCVAVGFTAGCCWLAAARSSGKRLKPIGA